VVTLTSPSQQYVSGLDVSVDEPLLVGRVERGGDLKDDSDRALRLKMPGGSNQLLEIRAFDVTHDELCKIIRLAGGVDGNDVGMFERSSEP
jgi:hypothetical protein